DLLYTEEELLEMERKRQKEREGFWDEYINTTKEATEALEDYGKEGKTATEKVQKGLGGVVGALEEVERETDTAKIGMEHWRREGLKGTDQLVFGFKRVERASRDFRMDIGKIPTLIDFDIVGKLHMPEIPRVRSQVFDIWGKYHAPDIPRYRTGGQTFQKGGISEPGELVLNKPITDWIRRAMDKPGPTGYIPSIGGSNISPANKNRAINVNIPRGAVIVYGDIRTKMDVEELEETLGQKLGEDIARRLIEV
ncbi:unnamed protein product, partial [marine sediment metagenome]